jgi:hypothetical protein
MGLGQGGRHRSFSDFDECLVVFVELNHDPSVWLMPQLDETPSHGRPYIIPYDIGMDRSSGPNQHRRQDNKWKQSQQS